MNDYDLILAGVAASLGLADFLLGRRGRFLPRLVVYLVCFAGLSLVLTRRLGSPLTPIFPAPSETRLLLELLVAVWWAMAARLLVLAARLLITRQARPRESRILSDLLAGVIYIAAALGVVAFVLGIPVRGLLATSGVVAIVVGLALQSTLSDLFSGIAVGVERPYRTGDFVSIDGGHQGRVVEINWRSTHLKTGHDLAIIPNSIVAKSKLVNHSAPSPVSGETLDVHVHPDVPPRRVMAVLEAALLSCESLAAAAAPTVRCAAISGDGVTYTLSFAAASADRAASARSEVAAQAHRHLFHAGVPLAVPGEVPNGPWQMRNLAAGDLLAGSDLFAGISEENRRSLGGRASLVELEPGEVLFKEGNDPHSMFLIAEGTIEVRVSANAHRFLLAPGETVGLVALVRGEPYRTTATALNACRAYRLSAPDLAAALQESAGLADDLEAVVRRALAVMARFEAGEMEAGATQRRDLLQRWRAFIGVARGA